MEVNIMLVGVNCFVEQIVSKEQGMANFEVHRSTFYGSMFLVRYSMWNANFEVHRSTFCGSMFLVRYSMCSHSHINPSLMQHIADQPAEQHKTDRKEK